MKTLTGKVLKSIKNYNTVVIRLHNRWTTLDLSNETVIQTLKLDDTHKQIGDWVYSFANQPNTNWQFFINALKPTDTVTFYVRNNSNQFVEEANMITEELRVRINSHKRDGTLSSKREFTLVSRTVFANNCLITTTVQNRVLQLA